MIDAALQKYFRIQARFAPTFYFSCLKCLFSFAVVGLYFFVMFCFVLGFLGVLLFFFGGGEGSPK